MPHDMNGELLKVGDEVLIPARVASLQVGDEYCNASFETLISMYPSDSPTTITMNTKQVELKK